MRKCTYDLNRFLDLRLEREIYVGFVPIVRFAVGLKLKVGIHCNICGFFIEERPSGSGGWLFVLM